MTTLQVPGPFEGVMVALLTPVDDSGQPDLEAVARLSRRAVDGGVVGVCPLGSTGEGASLDRDCRLQVTETVAGAVTPDVWVVPGVFAPTSGQCLEEVAAYADHGARAALVAPPSYLPLAQDAIGRFYAAVADHSRLPLVMYNIPALTKNAVGPGVVAALSGHHSVIGIKDSSRDLEYHQSVLAAARVAGTLGNGFSVMTGSATLLLASLVLGCQGAIDAGANLAPELLVSLYRATTEGRLEEARADQDRLLQLALACRAGGPAIGWKAAVAAAGLCRPDPVWPRGHLDPSQTAELVERLSELGVLGYNERTRMTTP